MTVFRNLRTVKEVLDKPKFPMKITLRSQGQCCDCHGRLSKGQEVMWAGPNTGLIWHPYCSRSGHRWYDPELEYLEMEAMFGHKDWW